VPTGSAGSFDPVRGVAATGADRPPGDRECDRPSETDGGRSKGRVLESGKEGFFGRVFGVEVGLGRYYRSRSGRSGGLSRPQELPMRRRGGLSGDQPSAHWRPHGGVGRLDDRDRSVARLAQFPVLPSHYGEAGAERFRILDVDTGRRFPYGGQYGCGREIGRGEEKREALRPVPHLVQIALPVLNPTCDGSWG